MLYDFLKHLTTLATPRFINVLERIILRESKRGKTNRKKSAEEEADEEEEIPFQCVVFSLELYAAGAGRS